LIKNIPNHEKLNDIALSQHFFAWEKTLNLLTEFQECFSNNDIADLISNPTSPEWYTYIGEQQRSLHAYYALMQQSNELALKAKLCKVSPYLLLMGISHKFSNKNAKEIDFSELKTINAIDLIHAVNSFTDFTTTNSFNQRFSDVRKMRNKILHLGMTSSDINIICLLRELIDFYIELWPDRNWLKDRKHYCGYGANSMFEDGKYYTQIGQTLCEWNISQTIFTKKQFKETFGIEKTRRKYVCLNCYYEAGRKQVSYHEFPDMSCAYLTSQSSLRCLICEKQISVSRNPCQKVGCNGNVISVEEEYIFPTCLSCGFEQE